MPIEFLRPNPRNPRRHFAEAELDELAASIRERGIIQPILVRTVRGAIDQYEIVAGERRWRAAQRAGLHDVPVVVLEVNDREALELAIIENVQRADLNPLEEAGGYQALVDEFKYGQDELAKIVGKSRSHVANTLRLLKLPESVQDFIRSGKLTAGHARALIGQADPEALAQAIIDAGPERARGRSDRAGARRVERQDGDAPRARREGRRHARAGEAALRRARPRGRRSSIAAAAARCGSATRRSSSSTTSCRRLGAAS